MAKTLWGRGRRVLRAVLAETRAKSGLSQRELAELLRWPRSRVAKIETGEQGIDPVECAAWAKACGVAPRTFFGLFCRALERASKVR